MHKVPTCQTPDLGVERVVGVVRQRVELKGFPELSGNCRLLTPLASLLRSSLGEWWRVPMRDQNR
jgi:hypothetical protein